MGYWIITDERGNYVTETDTYEQAAAYVGDAPFTVIPYYEFYGLGSA